MKALRWYARKDVRYEDVPEPSPGAGQVKVGDACETRERLGK
jgi:NADPH:quinone reductase-like Zn-dependent oxidoreductase